MTSQFPLQSVQLLPTLRRELFQTLPIHTTAAAVCLYTLLWAYKTQYFPENKFQREDFN